MKEILAYSPLTGEVLATIEMNQDETAVLHGPVLVGIVRFISCEHAKVALQKSLTEMGVEQHVQYLYPNK